MDATKTAEAIDSDAYAFEVRQLNAAIIAYHHMFYVTTTIDKRPNLSSGLVRQLGKLPGKFRSHDLVGSNSPCVELGDASELIWLETGSVAENVFNVQSLPLV
jgi:hypothetical protein